MGCVSSHNYGYHDPFGLHIPVGCIYQYHGYHSLHQIKKRNLEQKLKENTALYNSSPRKESPYSSCCNSPSDSKLQSLDIISNKSNREMRKLISLESFDIPDSLILSTVKSNSTYRMSRDESIEYWSSPAVSHSDSIGYNDNDVYLSTKRQYSYSFSDIEEHDEEKKGTDSI
jgi:hypothetical protein